MESTSAGSNRDPPYDPCHKLVCEPEKSKIQPIQVHKRGSPFTKEVPVVISPTESVMWPKRVAVIGYGQNKPFEQAPQLHISYFV